eukprot:Blabericola_migrator_1__1006@NODE_1253_length_4978_cov_98_123396_g847_i0_p1_GENE_NODE_1253_length_4978_cov_98_123396_g847_i0NODE_1253_length_4978_cov_98_123396_g847_i0_p1_ORF_typecomplete_len700_score96_38Aa_trans/PF01490_18/0_019Aa_trans/PF01490_18/0_67_NODE_1253_length_4978_cov_98_123396_g847_i027774876
MRNTVCVLLGIFKGSWFIKRCVVVGGYKKTMSVEYPDDAIPASVPSRRRSVARPETQASWSAFFGKHLFKRSTSIANDKTEHIKRHLQKSAKLEPRLDMGHTPFRITFVGGNKTITQGTAILMILNQLFGGALEEVPQGYLIAGWFPMTFLNFTISSLALTACLMTARVMTMIPGNQFFNQRFEYVATVRHFLGTHVSHIIEVCFHLLICHSLLSFNDAVSAIETFVVRPLYGSTLHFEWDPPGIPRFVSQPLPIDNFINRLQTPPWFTSLSVTGDTRMDTPHTPRIRISVSYILLALVATFLSGRNLDDDPWIQHVAFAFSTSMWLLIMGVCVSRAPVWEIWSKQGLDLLQGVDAHPPAGSSFAAAVKQIYITMSPFRIFGRFCLRKLARLRLGVLRLSRLYTDTLGTFTRVAPIVGLLAPSSPTLLAAGRLPGVLGHFPGLSPEYVNPYAFELSRETPVYLTDLLKDQQVFVIPDVTPLNADYSIYNLTAFSLAADIRRHSRRRLLSTKAHSHTPHAPHSFDDWILANQCGTCYDDLCWDYLEHSSLLVCPTPEWATRWQSHTVRRYIETRYAEKRDEPPLIPHTLRTHTRNHFALLAVFVRLWSVTDMVPSLVNEMRTEVDVAQTFFSAFWIGGAGILILTFTVAAAFPGLSAFQGVSPVTLITDSALPQMLSNILLCSYAIFTILPRKYTHPAHP